MKLKIRYYKNKPPALVHKCDMVFEKRTTFPQHGYVRNFYDGEWYQFQCKDCGRKGAVRVREFLGSARPAESEVSIQL